MDKVQTIQLYQTPSGFALYRNRVLINRFHDKGYALRIAKQVFDATVKLATAPVFFEDQTGYITGV